MKTIWKARLTPNGNVVFPIDAQILSVQMQGNEPNVWALVDSTDRPTVYRLKVFGTGHEIDREVGRFIGTVQFDGMVFHVFE